MRQPVQGLRHSISRRLFRQVQLDEVFPEPSHTFTLSMDDHALAHRRRAGGRGPLLAVDLAKTHTAGPEGCEMVRRTQSRNDNPGLFRRDINRVACRGLDRSSVNFQLHLVAPYLAIHLSYLVVRRDRLHERRFTLSVIRSALHALSLLRNSAGKCSMAVSTG